MPDELECGHPPDFEGGQNWRAVAYIVDGRYVCKQCAAKAQQQQLRVADTALAFADRSLTHVTTAGGVPLLTIETRGAENRSSKRRQIIARDPRTGRLWIGHAAPDKAVWLRCIKGHEVNR